MYKKRLEADDTLGLYEQVDAWVDTLWVDLDQAIAKQISQRKSESFLNSNSKGIDKDATTTTSTTDASANEARDHSNSAVSSSYKGIPALQPAP